MITEVTDTRHHRRSSENLWRDHDELVRSELDGRSMKVKLKLKLDYALTAIGGRDYLCDTSIC